MTLSSAYVGRFAPSPTGPLHFGSLLAALASYLDARAHEGRWLLRIEDLDPPREQPGARDSFPSTLEAFGLGWDNALILQSERTDYYQDALNQLLSTKDAYRCSCSRKEIQLRAGGSVYDRHCLFNPVEAATAAAVRVRCPDHVVTFSDRIQYPLSVDLAQSSGDFVVLRKDGLFAYQLAVVVDDHLQGITHVVRGSDLLTETPRQIHLQQRLHLATPVYAHIPVAANAEGQKLSKQTFAQALDLSRPVPQLVEALRFLQQQPDTALLDGTVDEVLHWAVRHWKMDAIPKQMQQHWEPANDQP